MTKAQERARYIESLQKAGLSDSQIHGLHIMAAKLQRAEEILCSVEYVNSRTTGDEYHEKVSARVRAWIEKLAASLPGIEFNDGGDVRGCVVKLRGRGLPCTSFGGDGWFCIEANGFNESQINAMMRTSDAISERLDAKRKAEREAAASQTP